MELIVAIGILVVAILLVIGEMTFLFKTSEKGVDMSAGTVVADSIMQQVVSTCQQGIPAATSPAGILWTKINGGLGGGAYTLDEGTIPLNKTDFNYGAYVYDISNLEPHIYSVAEGGAAVASGDQDGWINPQPNFPLCRVVVVVSWWASSTTDLSGTSGQRGYGRLQVQLTRTMVYNADY